MHAQRGGSIVELALIATVMLILLFGILELGQLLYAYHAVANGARLGARWASTHGAKCTDTTTCPVSTASPSPLSQYVIAQSPGLSSNNLTVTPTWTSPPSAWFTHVSAGCSQAAQNAGCLVTVTVTYHFPFTVPFGVPDFSTTSQAIVAR